MEGIWELVATAWFLLSFSALVLRWLAGCGARLPAPFSDPLPGRAGRTLDSGELWRVFLIAILFRVVVALGSLFLYNRLSGSSLGLADLPGLWVRWDGTHYVKLVELGYDGYVENGQHLFLVFYPLYVWLVRLFRLLIPHTAVAGMTVSALCFGWGSAQLYALTAEEYGGKTAGWTLALLWAFPFSFFFGSIMTESLFLLTTAAGLRNIRRHRWGRAALWGILAAMTRMQGVILIGAAIAELCNEEKPLSYSGGERKKALLDIGRRLPLLCAPVLGSFVYLALNYTVTGNPFTFTEMQEHWSQGFMWFPKVLAYLIRNAFGWYKVTTRWEMWIPELVLFPIFAILLWRSWKKHRSMLTLYGFVYFILNYCLSWLLSAGRYLSCALPCFIFAADELEERPRLAAAVVAVMGLLQIFFLYRYLSWGQVM